MQTVLLSYGSFALKAILKPDVRQAPENYTDLLEEKRRVDTEQG